MTTLANLVHRYRREVNAFNGTHHPDDDAFERHAGETFRVTRDAMVGTPIISRLDALAAIEILGDEVADAGADNVITRSMLTALRTYIEA